MDARRMTKSAGEGGVAKRVGGGSDGRRRTRGNAGAGGPVCDGTVKDGAGGFDSAAPRLAADRRAGSPPHGVNPHLVNRGVVDRRLGLDRRGVQTISADGGGEDRTGLARRRGPGRRRSDFMKSAEEGEMTREQFLFLMAVDAFKKANDKLFPSWTDVLEVIRMLGYRKTMPSELNLRNAEDWAEPADAPAKTRTIELNPVPMREAA